MYPLYIHTPTHSIHLYTHIRGPVGTRALTPIHAHIHALRAKTNTASLQACATTDLQSSPPLYISQSFFFLHQNDSLAQRSSPIDALLKINT